MSTKAQVAQLVRPYLERHPELALVGREVVLPPVHHLLRNVYIDRTSSKGAIRPKWGIGLLFGWGPRLTFGFGQELPRGWGYIGAPDLADRLFREMDHAFDHILRPSSELGQLFAVAKIADPRGKIRSDDAALLFAALGRFGEATAALSAHVALHEEGLERRSDFIRRYRRPNSRPWQRDMAVLAEMRAQLDGAQQLLRALKTENRREVATLLHQWEAERVELLRLQHLWEPTPFPIEQGAGD